MTATNDGGGVRMSLNISEAITAMRALSTALGPRAPGSNAPPKASIDLGVVPLAEYEQVVAMLREVFAYDEPQDDGTTALDFTGYVLGVTVHLKSSRPSTRVELAARIERLKMAIEQAALAAMTREVAP